MAPHAIRAGGPCTCNVGRTVRFAIPPVPGLPRGEVSCREQGSAEWRAVRHHDLPEVGAVVEVMVPGLPEPDPGEYCAHMLGAPGSCARCEGT